MKPAQSSSPAPSVGLAALRFLALPSLLTPITCLLINQGQSRLPAKVATHFNARGAADGFTDHGNFIWTTAALIITPVLVLFVIAIANKFRGPQGRILAAAAGFVSGLITTISLTILTVQSGLTDTVGLHMHWWELPLALGVGLLTAGLGYLTSARVPLKETPANPLPGLDILAGSNVAYATQITFGPWYLAIVLVVLGMTVTLPWLLQQPLLAIPLVFALIAVAALYRCNLLIGAHGVRCRSWLGFNLRYIPRNDITGASALVQTAAELGGWGYRFTGNGSGISTGGGMTLRVHRNKGSDWFCSLAGAETAAATVNALVAQRDRN